LLGALSAWQWKRGADERAEAAAKEAHLLAELQKLEKGTSVDMQAVDTLKKSFETDFTAAVAARPEHDKVLDKGVQVLDKMSASSPADPNVGIKIADTYQQLGSLQESTSAGKNRQAAVGTYQKAAVVLGNVIAQHPDNADAKQRLARVNEGIRTLQSSGGTQVASQPAPETPKPDAMPSPPPPAETAPATTVVATKRPAPAPTKVAPPVETAPPSAPPVQAAPPPPPPAAPSPEMLDAEERLVNATSKVEIAEQTIEPVKQSLAKTGQSLNPDTSSAMVNMRSRLARAKRDIAAGDAAAAKEDIAAAEALATKVLRSVGR
jgi:hypothetical protein